MYLMIRLAGKTMFGERIFDFFASIVRRYVQDASDKTVTDIGKLAEINAMAIMNLYLLRRCCYSFVLEILAD